MTLRQEYKRVLWALDECPHCPFALACAEELDGYLGTQWSKELEVYYES